MKGTGLEALVIPLSFGVFLPPVHRMPESTQPTMSKPSPNPLGPIKVQKRETEPKRELREKLCADCHRPFTITVDQKFFLCPACYQRRAPRKPVRKGETKVLIQIKCVDCGAQDYLDFMPTDPTHAFCRACYLRRKREQKIEP